MKSLFLIPIFATLLAMVLASCLALYDKLKSPALSAATILIPLTLFLFMLEHFWGLGSLQPLYPVVLLVSGFVIYSKKEYISAVSADVAAFAVIFLLAFSWRWIRPDLNGSTELLTNLNFVASHLRGDTLPGPDLWQSGYKLDIYYTFQHYCAALLGRIFGLGPATTYHIGFAAIYGFMALALWSAFSYWSKSKFYSKALIMLATFAGGTGLAPFTSYLITPDGGKPLDAWTMTVRIWSNVRFSGIYEKSVNTPLGESLFPAAERAAHSDSPLETLGYFLYIGDYHATLGSFLIAALLFLLASFFVSSAKNEKQLFASDAQNSSTENTTQATDFQKRTASFLLGITCCIPFAINIWTVPFSIALSVALMLFYRKHISWRYLCAGLVITAIFLQPFFSYYLLSGGRGVELLQTPEELKNPVFMMLIQAWPAMVLGVLALIAHKKFGAHYSSWVVPLVLVLGFFFFDYFGFKHDGYFDRFNTAIKSWSWLYFVAIIWCGSLVLLRDNFKPLKIIGMITLLAVASFSIDLYRFNFLASKDGRGYLTGDRWLGDQNGPKKQLKNYLESLPDGVALEGEPMKTYSHFSAIPLLASKQSYLAWGHHEILWRKDRKGVDRKAKAIRAFYDGSMPNKLQWLEDSGVDYVLLTDHKSMDKALFDKVNKEIGAGYYWVQFSNTPMTGMWQKIKK